MAISGCQPPSAGVEAQRRHPVLAGEHRIAHLAARQPREAQLLAARYVVGPAKLKLPQREALP